MSKASVHKITLKDILSQQGAKHAVSNFHLFSFTYENIKPAINKPYRSDFFTLLFVKNGSAQLQLNLVDYQAIQNTIILVYPNFIFQFTSSSEDLLLYGVAFTPAFLAEAGINKKYLNTLEFLSSLQLPLLQLKQSEADRLYSVLDVMNKQRSVEASYPFRTEIIHHLFSAFMYELASVYTRNQTDQPVKLSRNEEVTVGFLKLLPEHFKEERSVKWYAEHLFVTPKYLSQTVKEATGKTASFFIDEMVLLEAKMLLNDASKSVAQIAEELHFSDQFFFSKFFKRMSGTTPTEYRRRSY